tara:strand:+ start:11245 stop:12759 length:1515 start_codon:yes stop_codon:yes gene_type:complete
MPFLAIIDTPGSPPKPVNILNHVADHDELARLSDACERGEVRLLDCDCPIHVVQRGRTPFFRHNPSHQERHPERDAISESEEHANLKFAALTQAMSLGYQAIPEAGEEEWRADALIIGKDGKRIAVEIQLSHHTAADVVNRTKLRSESGVQTVWFFGDKVNASTLTTETRSQPFFRLPNKGRVEFVRRMITLYLSKKVALLSKPSKTLVAIQPIVFDVMCWECKKNYTILHSVTCYPNEIWSDEEGPIVHFFEHNKLFQTVINRLRLGYPWKQFSRPRLSTYREALCPHCESEALPIKLSKEVAEKVPRDGITTMKVSLQQLGFRSSPFNIWGEKLPPPKPPEQMSDDEWGALYSMLLEENQKEFEEACRKRDEEHRKKLEQGRRQREEAQKGNIERQVAIRKDKKRVWSTIQNRLKPALEKDQIEFDVIAWSSGKIPFNNMVSFYAKTIEISDLVENRSPTLASFENALDEIIAMSEPGGPVVDQLLGLPVKGWRQARLDEQK